MGLRCLRRKTTISNVGRDRGSRQEAIERDIVTLVACNMRFHPGPAMLRQLLNERAIGDLTFYRVHTGSYLPAWRAKQDYRQSYSASTETGGAILDCIHELDLRPMVRWSRLSSPLAKHVPATAIGLQTDGLAEICFSTRRGRWASVHLISSNETIGAPVCAWVQKEHWNGPSTASKWCNMVAPRRRVVRHSLPSDWQVNDMYLEEMRHFLDCIAQGRPHAELDCRSLPCLQLALEARASTL